MPKMILVGDSTVCKFNDVSYYYPRYGYGTMMDKYFNLEVLNLALSGRSAKSFLEETNYKTLLESLNEGDYLVIGFGHNDQKSDDSARFASAKEDINTEGSFKYMLNEYYIKPALKAKANVIVCSPIPRLDLNNKYEGKNMHLTPDGDYSMVALELGKEVDVTGIDLTRPFRDFSLKIGKDQLLLHAISKGKRVNGEVVYDELSVDKTHLSSFGALATAYLFAKEINKSNSTLKNYLKSDIKEPTLDELKINPYFVYKDYVTPDLANYNPKANFKCEKPYYGTAFGTLDKDPNSYFAYQTGDKFYVGNKEYYGKINASTDGIAFAFRQISKKDNFKMSCHARVAFTEGKRQAAFGMMLRSDSFINQDCSNENITSNYIAPGILTTDKISYIIFDRKNPTDLEKGTNILEEFYKLNDEADIVIERLGQVVFTTLFFRGKIYKKQFVDFDYLSVDHDYVYCGMFATGGTFVEFSNVSFEITGKAKEA